MYPLQKKKKCEIVFKDAGDQVKIDDKKLQSYSSSLSKFKDSYFDFGLINEKTLLNVSVMKNFLELKNNLYLG